MKAIVLQNFGGTEQLQITEIDKPQIKENEVLVQVKAFSINPVDAKTRNGKAIAGLLKDIPQIILGWDLSGVIVEKGKDVQEFNINDAVFGMVNFAGHGQAYAEYVAVPASQLALKPENISHEEAAAATLAALTAWQALVNTLKIQSNQKLLVHSASGGVGHFAIQIARHFGTYVIGTSSAANKQFVLDMGANEHIDYKNQRFEEVTRDLDFVLDSIGGDNAIRSLNVIKKGGTVISLPSGLSNNITEKAKTMGVHCYYTQVKSSGEDMKSIADLLSKGIIKSHVSKVFAFNQIAEAHDNIESGRTVGKIVVKI